MNTSYHKKRWNFIRERIKNLIPAFFTIFVCLALVIGWRMKRLELITPAHGAGWAFGILGMALMIILFIYSLKKRVRSLEAIGTVQMWFRIHMVLGVIGPLFILFHANFSLGALNSDVALFSMLIVAISGIIGRYIYTRVHYGLYGERANLLELQNNFEQQKEEAGLHFALIPGVKEEMISFSNNVLDLATILRDSVKRLLIIRWKAESAMWKIQHISRLYFDQYAMKHNWGFFKKLRMQMRLRHKARLFIAQVIKVAEFNFYERLFSFWHILHIPLVFILIFTVMMHLVAANRY